MTSEDGSDAEEALDPVKESILEKRLRGAVEPSEERGIHAGSLEGELPLSWEQERFWLLHELHPEDAAYNVPVAYRIRGELDRDALLGTFEWIADRHAVLRSSFELGEEGEPVQRVGQEHRWDVEVVDVSEEGVGMEEARNRLSQWARAPFDLTERAVRIRLLQLGEQDHLLLMVAHHIVFDGWSIDILREELEEGYRALHEGWEPTLSPLEVQYADYARWQKREYVDSQKEDGLSFWRDRLDGSQATEFPPDRSRPAVQDHEGSRYTFSLGAPVREAVEELAERTGTTSFMVLLAAFKGLLYRYTRERDLVVGTPVVGREQPELEGLVGPFLNTLVLRTRLSGGVSFSELVERVRETCLAAYDHRRVPFERLVQELVEERDRSRHPLFQIMFQFHNQPGGSPTLPGLDVERVPCEEETSKFDLSFELVERAGQFEGWVEYDTDLYDRETIVRFVDHFERFLSGALADVDAAVGDLDFLSPEERRKVLGRWASSGETSTELPLHGGFERQVERVPDRVALRFDGGEWSYRELNERAASLAAWLDGRGIGIGDRVGVACARGPDMVSAVLATLKRGACYVPLDPRYPGERLEAMVDVSGVELVLTEGALREGGFPSGSLEVVDIGELEPSEVEGDRYLSSPRSQDLLAYVMFTSGSTGSPKAIATPHRGPARFLEALQGIVGLGARDTVLPVASPSFDPSVRELWTPLWNGARVVLVEEDRVRDPRALREAVEEHEVTHLLGIVPTLLEGLVEAYEEGGETGESLELVVSNGEALRPRLCERVWTCFPSVELLNLYGPTESTMASTYHHVDWGELDALENPCVPVGRPFPGSHVWVVDGRGNPVPPGVVGEVCVAGDGVNPGYLGRSGLTAESFLPVPGWGQAQGERMYRTGDLGRWRSDGVMEFMGRVDRQLKVRGHRVEPGEVETRLRTSGSVENAVVVAREAETGTQLVGYVVPSGEDVQPQDLRDHVAGRVPRYMVPGRFVPVDSIPLTPNGKVDRSALPEPDTDRPSFAAEYVPPSTATEAAVAEIWEEVLGVDRVGRHDDFFEMGGHSLLATQMVGRLERSFGVEIDLQVVFEASTPKLLGGHVQKKVEAMIEELDEAEARELLSSKTEGVDRRG